MTDRIPLPHVPRHLAAFEGPRPGYAAVYRATLDGVLPAEQTQGRWFIRADDLPKVAQHFGMTLKTVG